MWKESSERVSVVGLLNIERKGWLLVVLNTAFLNKDFAVFLNFPVLISLTIFKT